MAVNPVSAGISIMSKVQADLKAAADAAKKAAEAKAAAAGNPVPITPSRPSTIPSTVAPPKPITAPVPKPAAPPPPTPQQPNKVVAVGQPVPAPVAPKPLPNLAGGPPLPSLPTGSAPAKPAMTPQEAAALAKTQLIDDMKFGEDFANKHFYDGALGRMDDPRQAEMNALLAKLAARQDGMTPDELRAASEQGTAAIDAQLAQNQRKLASIAGANGLRGGAAGGLQMGALNEATGQRAQLARQLVLDNLAQKSQNLEQYGKALTGQQGTELGIQDRNLGLKGQEAFGRASTPLQISGVLDSSRQGILANDLAKTNVDIAKDYVRMFGQTGGYGGKPTSDTQSNVRDASGNLVPVNNEDSDKIRSELDAITQQIKSAPLKNTGNNMVDSQNAVKYTQEQSAKARDAITRLIAAQYPSASEAERAALIEQMYNDWLTKNGIWH